MEKFDQYAHKEQYSLPRSAKLVGFVVVNEEKEDMLAFFDETDGILRSAYTKALSAALRFKTIEKAQDVIETLEKPLLVSAVYETKGKYFAACVMKYTPILP